MDDIILKKFLNLDEPSSYSSINEIKRVLNNKFSTNEIRNVLSKNFVYSLYKPRRYRFKRRTAFGSGFFYDNHADLGDFQALEKYNDGYRYLLLLIDVLSKQIVVMPVKSKFAKDMQIAFDELFKKIPVNKIDTLYTDNGTEFKSKAMQNYFKSKNINNYYSKNDQHHAFFAERALRTVKSRLYKHFAAANSLNWINVIDKIVDNINHSFNRSIGTIPAKINKNNWFKLWKKLFSVKRKSINTQKTYFKVNDFVRIVLKRQAFDKSYLSNYTDELFKIVKINKTSPLTFVLEDANKKVLERKFYAAELSLSDEQTLFRVEKILKTRTRKGITEHFVKWEGFSSKHNSWIKEDDV